MCGIVGCLYSSDQDTDPYKHIVSSLTKGLQQLEYRGYDSSGICVVTPSHATLVSPPGSFSAGNERVVLLKRVGNVQTLIDAAQGQDVLIERKDDDDGDGTHGCWTGIGHTRWSTHGIVSEANTHPHASFPGLDFIVVHNGIITNYAALRTRLEEAGYTFMSQTDTEVIPVLCHHYYHTTPSLRSSFVKLVGRVVRDLTGYYAFLLVSPLYPGQMAIYKCGSPVVIGFSTTNRDYMVASDQTALIGFVDSVADMDDRHVLVLKEKGEYSLENTTDNEQRQLVWRPFSVTSSFISKGDYRYFMEKEIHEQPISIKNTCKGRLQHTGESRYTVFFSELEGLQDIFCSVRRIILLACGSSYNSCMAVRPFFEQIFSLPVAIENSCDFLDRDVFISEDDLCIVLSQSGETLDTHMALKTIRQKNARTIGIVNGVGSSIAKACDYVIYNNIGVEIGVASTKTYTSQVLLLILLGVYFEQMSRTDDRFHRKFKPIPEDTRQNLIDDIHRLPTLIEHILCSSYYVDRCQSITSYMTKQKQHSVLLIGRKYNVATILEASLKFKEVSYLHCEGIMAGELKHGPLALIDDKMLVIVVATQDAKMNSNIEQLLSRKGRLIILKDRPEVNDQNTTTHILPKRFSDPDLQEEGREPFVIELPVVEPPLRPIVDIILFQILSFMFAVENGHNVDQPRNLAKSVTVTD